MASRARRQASPSQRTRRKDGSPSNGFPIDGNTLITNNHVLPDAATAGTSIARFNYQLTAERPERADRAFRLLPDTFFLSHLEGR
jgi:hypothetical protein